MHEERLILYAIRNCRDIDRSLPKFSERRNLLAALMHQGFKSEEQS